MASDAVVNLVVNAADADNQVMVQMRRIVNDAERNTPPVTINVNIDNESVVRQIRRLETAMSDSLGRIGDDIRDGFGDLSNIISSQLDESNQRLAALDDRLEELTRTLAQVGDAANNNLGDLDRQVNQADQDTDRLGRTMARLGSTLAGIGRTALSIGSIGVAAGGAIPLVAGLATSLANIAPAAAAGVTAFVALKFATATLQVAMIGVQDAISAVFDPDADPEALAEAMERLAPEAQSFVRELQRMKPAFEDLRLDLQSRVFRNLDTDLRRLGNDTLPIVRSAARSFADTFNDMARNAVGNARTLSAEGSLGQALGSGARAFQNLERVPGQVLLAIGRLAAAGGPLLERFTESIGGLFDRLSVRMTDAVASGGLEDAVSNAGDVLAQLGDIAGNVGEIISNVFGAAQLSGEGLFGSLERITEALADVTATTQFQETLALLMDTAALLAEQILPILGEAFNALFPIFEIILPPLQDLIRVLGDELLGLIPELQPVLIEMAGAFVAIVEAVIPLIPPLANIIEQLLPLLIFFFRGLAEIIENVVAPILLVLVEGLSVLVEAFNNMAGDTLRDFVIPIIQTFVALLNGDMKTAQEIAAGVTRRLVDSQIRAFSDFAARVQRFAVEFVSSLSRGANEASQAFLRRMQEMISQLSRFLGQIPGMAARQLSGLGQTLVAAGQSLIQGFINGMLSMLGPIRNAANSIVSAARDYFPFSPARRGPFSGRGYTLYSGRKLVDDFGKGIEQRKVTLQGIVRTVLGNAATGFGIDPLSVTGPATSSLGALTASSLQRTTLIPNISVRIGNEAVDQYVTVIVDDNNAQRDREASQGTRF